MLRSVAGVDSLVPLVGAAVKALIKAEEQWASSLPVGKLFDATAQAEASWEISVASSKA